MIPVLLARMDRNVGDFIKNVVTKGESKSRLVSISLARALVDSLPLPTEPVDSVELYFSKTHKQKVLNTIIVVNETLCLNTTEVMDYVKKFYNYRCAQASVDNPVLYVSKETPLEDFFGISKCFSKEMIETIKENGSTLGIYVSRFKEIIEKIEA